MNLKPPYLTNEQWANTEPKEKALLMAAVCADKLKIREQGGANRGEFVTAFLKDAGIDFPAPWCASFVFSLLKQAGYSRPLPSGPAAVRNWASWAKARSLITGKPGRGDLFFWVNPDGTGHIGFVVSKVGPVIKTIEGNTNEAGSREGDGVYRKTRIATGKIKFITL